MHDSLPPHLLRRAYGYIRVSTDKQEQEGDSLETQAARIRDFAAGNKLVLLHTYEDIGSARHGGRKDSLPALHQAFREAHADNAPVIVTSIDRISRNEGAARRLLQLHPVTVISVSDGRALTTDEVLAAVGRAEAEGERIAAKTSADLLRRKQTGKKLGSPGDKKKAAARSARVRSLNKSETVERIADHLAGIPARQSLSARDLAESLNNAGIFTSVGRGWTIAGLRRPLRAARALLQEREVLAAEVDPFIPFAPADATLIVADGARSEASVGIASGSQASTSQTTADPALEEPVARNRYIANGAAAAPLFTPEGFITEEGRVVIFDALNAAGVVRPNGVWKTGPLMRELGFKPDNASLARAMHHPHRVSPELQDALREWLDRQRGA